jgi:hypothetical protein
MNVLQIADSGTWSLGVLVGLPLFALLLIALVIGGILLIRFDRRVGSYDRGIPKALGIGSLITAALVAVTMVTPAGYYPFSAEYHQWREASGTVVKIDKRLISSGKDSMEDKFVVRFEGDGQQFGCDDTRCAGVEVGDSLTLSCKRAWQYTGTDGYDCRFVSTEAAA